MTIPQSCERLRVTTRCLEQKDGQQRLVQERPELLVLVEQRLLVQAPLGGEEEGDGVEERGEEGLGGEEESGGERDRRGGLHKDPQPA